MSRRMDMFTKAQHKRREQIAKMYDVPLHRVDGALQAHGTAVYLVFDDEGGRQQVQAAFRVGRNGAVVRQVTRPYPDVHLERPFRCAVPIKLSGQGGNRAPVTLSFRPLDEALSWLTADELEDDFDTENRG